MWHGAEAAVSVRPPWASMLMDAEKTVELRRGTGRQLAGKVVAVYETAPVSAFVGTMLAEGMLAASPGSVWQAAAGRAGMSREEYDAWSRGAAVVVALWIRNPIRRDPVPLDAMREDLPGWFPPRSWRWTSRHEQAVLARRWRGT